MKMNGVTNAEDQLALLRLIIDNTWTAIKQQADAQAKQKTNKRIPKPRAVRQPAIRPPAPKPIRNQLAKPTQQVPPQQIAPSQNTRSELTPTERNELAKSTAITALEK